VVPKPLHIYAAWPEGAYISSIAVHPTDDQYVLVGFASYGVPSLWLTEDGGANWIDVEGNLAGPDGPSVRAVAILPFDGLNYHFAGTSTGVYSMLAPGGSETVWALEAAADIGNVIVDALAVRPADGLLVAATHGRGIWSLNLPPVSSTMPSHDVAVLEQNVPNPFNPQTAIGFRMLESGCARLTIFDLRGQLVRQLVDEELAVGPHSVTWDGRDGNNLAVAAGTYLYQLRVGTWVENKKLMLVR